jgi:hypothetical protein
MASNTHRSGLVDFSYDDHRHLPVLETRHDRAASGVLLRLRRHPVDAMVVPRVRASRGDLLVHRRLILLRVLGDLSGRGRLREAAPVQERRRRELVLLDDAIGADV